MNNIEVYKLRTKKDINSNRKMKEYYFPHMVVYHNDEKCEGRHSFVEWVNENYIVEQSEYFDKMSLSILKHDIQGKYRIILDKSYINSLIGKMSVIAAKEALLQNVGYEWSSDYDSNS